MGKLWAICGQRPGYTYRLDGLTQFPGPLLARPASACQTCADTTASEADTHIANGQQPGRRDGCRRAGSLEWLAGTPTEMLWSAGAAQDPTAVGNLAIVRLLAIRTLAPTHDFPEGGRSIPADGKTEAEKSQRSHHA